MPKLYDCHYVTNCVSSTAEAITPMVDKAIDVTRRTFLQHVNKDNLREIEQQLGYSAHPRQGLTMAGDWYVSYHRSVYRGQPCYFFRWSAIEHIFV